MMMPPGGAGADPLAGGDPNSLLQLLAMLGGTGEPGLGGAGAPMPGMGLPPGMGSPGGLMPQGLAPQGGGDENALLALLAQLLGGGAGMGGGMGGMPSPLGGGGGMPMC